jgi:hypothetical protein
MNEIVLTIVTSNESKVLDSIENLTVPSTIFYSSIRLDPLEELQLLKVAGSFPFRRQITAM